MSSLSFSISFEGSDIALAINEKTMLLPLVHISSTSTSPYLNNAPNFARPVPPDNEMMKVIANLVTELSPPESYPSLLVLYDSSSQYSKVMLNMLNLLITIHVHTHLKVTNCSFGSSSKRRGDTNSFVSLM